jgi:hypothetical protein
MLPGFRFLFAAIVLSMSILVFGLGAAALLRAAHEQFASNPSWRAAPEATFAQQAEATRPVLALLRVEPPAAPQKQSDHVPAVAAPVEQDTNLPTPAAQAPAASAPAETGQVAALKPEETPSPEVARSANPAPESPAPSEAAAAQPDAPASADIPKPAASDPDKAAPAPDKVASTEQVSPPVQDLPPPANVTPIASEPAAAVQASTPAPAEPDAASTKIATLGGPTVVVETLTPAKATGERHEDRDAIKKRQQARRAAQRRWLAARARLAARQAPQQTNPFAQPPTPAR